MKTFLLMAGVTSFLLIVAAIVIFGQANRNAWEEHCKSEYPIYSIEWENCVSYGER